MVTLSPEVEILGQREEPIFLRSMENRSADQVIVSADQDVKNRNTRNQKHHLNNLSNNLYGFNNHNNVNNNQFSNANGKVFP